jgi:hypothetical protein
MAELLLRPASRRGLLGAALGIIAAPAIVRASSLMPVRAARGEFLGVPYNGLLTVEMITEEAIQLFKVHFRTP